MLCVAAVILGLLPPLSRCAVQRDRRLYHSAVTSTGRLAPPPLPGSWKCVTGLKWLNCGPGGGGAWPVLWRTFSSSESHTHTHACTHTFRRGGIFLRLSRRRLSLRVCAQSKTLCMSHWDLEQLFISTQSSEMICSTNNNVHLTISAQL